MPTKSVGCPVHCSSVNELVEQLPRHTWALLRDSVVPSSEEIENLSTTTSVEFLYELNALLASTRRMASVSLSRKASLIACIAASIPAQSCNEPVASCRSPFVTVRMTLEIILLAVSHTPMDLTLGNLSSTINLHASSAERPRGSTCCLTEVM